MSELKTKLIQRFGKNIMIIEEGFDDNLLAKTIETLSEKPDVIIIRKDDGVVINDSDLSLGNLNEIVQEFKREPIKIIPYSLPMIEPYLDETKINSNPHRNPKSGNCKIVRK